MFSWTRKIPEGDSSNNKIIIPKEFREDYRNDIDKCVSLVREGKEEELETIINKKIENAILKTQIRNEINEITFAYVSLKGLRKLLPENDIIVKALIKDILELQILRRDTHFSERFAKYKIESEEDFANIIIAIIVLTRFYVINRYTQDCICEDFIEETRLPEEIAEEYAEFIEDHYRDMQMIMFIEKLSDEE